MPRPVTMSGRPSPLKSLQYVGVSFLPEEKLPLAQTDAAEILLPFVAFCPCLLLLNLGFILMAMASEALSALACCSALISFTSDAPASIVQALDSDCGSGTEVLMRSSPSVPAGLVR